MCLTCREQRRGHNRGVRIHAIWFQFSTLLCSPIFALCETFLSLCMVACSVRDALTIFLAGFNFQSASIQRWDTSR